MIPVWFIVPGTQPEPMLWQLPQVLAVIGVTVWAFAPVGRPLAEVPLWQVVQFVAAVTLWWLNDVGTHSVVV